MTNYDMDEIERNKSQKQKKQWRNYVTDSLKHPLDNRYSSQEGFGRDDQNNIQEILRKNSKIPSKPCQQWDAQTQSYVSIGDQVDDHLKKLEKHEQEIIEELDKDVKEMTDDPVGYELYNAPENILPPGDKDRPRLEKEEVTNPKHYDKVGFGIQPLEYIIANELDFMEGNVIKYVSRYPHKGGLNDLLKARTYIEKLIERERIKDE